MTVSHAWHDMTHEMRSELHDIAFIGRVAPARQAFLLLWATFAVVPLLLGLDKFAGVLTDRWEGYLATWVDDLVPGTAGSALLAVGIVEIVLALLVLGMPRIGGYVMAVWLALVTLDLLSTGEHHELALACLGALAAAVALARLATTFHQREGAGS